MTSENFALEIEMAMDFSKSTQASDVEVQLISAIRKLIPCDAIALLRENSGWLTPIATQGLSFDTLGRRFKVKDHPRFSTLCSMRSPYVFPSNCNLPDPYDGLLLTKSGDLPVHSCLGIPLVEENNLLGLITIDSLNVGAFEKISSKTLEVVACLGAQTLSNANAIKRLKNEAKQARTLVQELNDEALMSGGGEIIGRSQVIEKLRKDISLVATSDFNVLITGETGVGKELVARTLHHESARKHMPLVHVNCAALTETLAEAELFGHIKGAFTGADKNREGKFKLANKGTLFLDEVGELPFSVQSKLLRAIQSGEIQRVGEDKVTYVNVRVIAATNRDLENEVNNGYFRADLFHRLSVYPIRVPALKERDKDVLLIAGFFIERTRRKLGLRQLKLSSEAASSLMSYHWPGNVRELEHLISRASLYAKANSANHDMVVIDANCLDIHHQIEGTTKEALVSRDEAPLWGDSLKEMTESFQRQKIVQALFETDGNWAKASALLRHDRANFMRLAKRLGVSIDKNVSVKP
ncbi:nitric oxide reductase transcriptional regulator NorR [Alteromonas gracilis]|uniref:nitric oxide reductase transcriptional regulator NorR n=1 Tax=Alteromonas gracilis TaxID=1479524 RepID=UPI003736AB32